MVCTCVSSNIALLIAGYKFYELAVQPMSIEHPTDAQCLLFESNAAAGILFVPAD